MTAVPPLHPIRQHVQQPVVGRGQPRGPDRRLDRLLVSPARRYSGRHSFGTLGMGAGSDDGGAGRPWGSARPLSCRITVAAGGHGPDNLVKVAHMDLEPDPVGAQPAGEYPPVDGALVHPDLGGGLVPAA